MSGSWTPGPWRAAGSVHLVKGELSTEAHEAYCGDVFPAKGDYRGSISYLQSAEHIRGITREEAEANAKLIAAAPDLYKALEDFLVEWFEDDESTKDDPFADAARKALAKARGES